VQQFVNTSPAPSREASRRRRARLSADRRFAVRRADVV